MKRSVEHDHHDRAGGRHPHEAPPDHAARAAAEGHDDQAEPAGHAAHAAHADHAGHSPEAFRGRFWVSLLLTLPGTVLALASLWTIVPAGIALIVAVVRTALEDRTLQQELPGYREYTQRTRWRLVPGVY